MDSLFNFLHKNGASEAFIRDKDKLWYLSDEELFKSNIIADATVLKSLYLPLSKGVEIVFKNWDERVVLNGPEKFIKLIEDMVQSACKMSQGSIDYLAKIFQMDNHYKLRLFDNKEIEVFWSSNDSKCTKLWRRGLVQEFKYLIEKGPNVMRLTPAVCCNTKLNVNPS
jgi:hypothetical protein